MTCISAFGFRDISADVRHWLFVDRVSNFCCVSPPAPFLPKWPPPSSYYASWTILRHVSTKDRVGGEWVDPAGRVASSQLPWLEDNWPVSSQDTPAAGQGGFEHRISRELWTQDFMKALSRIILCVDLQWTMILEQWSIFTCTGIWSFVCAFCLFNKLSKDSHQ